MARPVVDWEAVEMQYRAGLRSLKDIGKEFGVSDAGIIKRAKVHGWDRDLSAKIKAKADAKVSALQVSAEVSAKRRATEAEVVNASAQAIVIVKMAHRADITRQRRLVNSLMTELEAVTDNPELFATLGELMESPDERGVDKLKDAYKRVISMSQRITGIKTLAEALRILIALEREAFDIVPAPTPGDNALQALTKAIQGNTLPIVHDDVGADDDAEG